MIRVNLDCPFEFQTYLTHNGNIIVGYRVISDGTIVAGLEFHTAEKQWTIETFKPMTVGFVAKVFETLTARLSHEQYIP